MSNLPDGSGGTTVYWFIIFAAVVITLLALVHILFPVLVNYYG